MPEAQVDRFMMLVKVDYPTKDEEREIINRQLEPAPQEVRRIITPQTIANAKKVIGDIYIDDRTKEYILDIIFATREPASIKELGPDFGRSIEVGASPRAIFGSRGQHAHTPSYAVAAPYCLRTLKRSRRIF